tara:strand:+ start:6044 stop:7066 length:1023 start_codon:yes stop_codon:yes gene_type:complete
MALDFNSDIAPLRSQFFPVSGMRASEFRQIQGLHDELVAPAQQRTMQLQNQIMGMQQQDMAYERAQIELGNARRSAQQQTAALEIVPEVTDKLTGIVNNPSKDPFDRVKEVNALAMGYSSTLAHSPVLQNMFQSATNSIQADHNKERDTRSQENRKWGLAHTLSQIGADELVEKHFGDGSGEVDYPSVYKDMANLFKTRQRAAQDKEEKKAEAAEIKRFTDQRRQNLRAHQNALLRIGAVTKEFLPETDEDGNIITEGKDPETPQDINIDDLDRSVIEEIMRDLNKNLGSETLGKFSTRDLYSAALRSMNREFRSLNPDPRPKTRKTTSGDVSIRDLIST